MLTPADIDKKRFGTTRLKEGYDQDEVDAFLDRVQEDYAFLQQTVARLEEDNRVLRRNSEPVTAVLETRPDPPSAVAEKLLEVATEAARQIEADAQERASKMLADAQAMADDTVREAGGRAAAVVEEAAEAAEKIKNEGLAEKYRRNEELDRKAGLLEQTVRDLNERGSQARRAMTAALAAYDKEVGQ